MRFKILDNIDVTEVDEGNLEIVKNKKGCGLLLNMDDRNNVGLFESNIL